MWPAISTHFSSISRTPSPGVTWIKLAHSDLGIPGIFVLGVTGLVSRGDFLSPASKACVQTWTGAVFRLVVGCHMPVYLGSISCCLEEDGKCHASVHIVKYCTSYHVAHCLFKDLPCNRLDSYAVIKVPNNIDRQQRYTKPENL